MTSPDFCQTLNALVKRYAPGVSEVCKTAEEIAIFKRALTHRSACADRADSSERTEFLGDAVLALCITDYLFQRYPGEGEGFMTRMRSQLVSGATLARICGRLPLGDLLVTSRPDKSPADLEDALEAFIGSIFICRGFDAARSWTIGVFEDHVDFASIVAKQDNPKDILNRYFVAHHGCLPQYQVSGSSTISGRAEVVIRGADGGVIATGSGENMRSAESDASRKALTYLGVNANV